MTSWGWWLVYQVGRVPYRVAGAFRRYWWLNWWLGFLLVFGGTLVLLWWLGG